MTVFVMLNFQGTIDDISNLMLAAAVSVSNNNVVVVKPCGLLWKQRPANNKGRASTLL